MAIDDNIFTEGPLTAEELIDAIRTQTMDRETQSLFTDTQIKLALRQAIIATKGHFFTNDQTTIAYVAGNLGPYTLPTAADRVILVTRERLGISADVNTLNGVSADQVIRSWRQRKNWEGNNLYFVRDYDSSDMTVVYESDVRVPIDSRVVSGDHTDIVTAVTLEDAAPNLWQMGLPAFMRWEDEIIKVTAVSGNTSMTVERGALGTTAADHDDGSEIEQLIICDSPALYNFLFSEVGRLLNQWRVQQGSRNTEVSANITATRFFDQDRERALRQIQQPHKTRRIVFTPTRRPRRSY